MAHSTATLLIAILSISTLYKNLVSSDSIDFISESYSCVHNKNASITYQNNVNLLLSDFLAQSSLRGYYNTSIGDRPDTVFGYYMCQGDLKPKACHNCIVNATRLAQFANCKQQDGAYRSEKCIYRYANHSMYGVWEQYFIQSYTALGAEASNSQRYNQTLLSTLEALIHEAAFESNSSGSVLGFATKEAKVQEDENIYTLAQCTPDIFGVNCSRCLSESLSTLQSDCSGYQGAWTQSANCVLRYDNRTFYLGNGNKLRSLDLVVITYSALFMLMYYTHLV